MYGNISRVVGEVGPSQQTTPNSSPIQSDEESGTNENGTTGTHLRENPTRTHKISSVSWNDQPFA